jgi:hypothetical protein
MKIAPTVPGPSGYNSPVYINGTCTISGCPNFRLDNLTVPEEWAGIGISDDSFSIIANMYGVADHNTIGGSPQAGSSGVNFINVNHGSWRGVGQYGNNSWASPDTLGTNQQIYLENNAFTNSVGTDTDSFGSPYGGGRFTCRFNTFNGITQGAACTNHGTEVTGITRGGRQYEMYGNLLTCTNPNGCNEGFGARSGVGRIFINTFQVSGGAYFSYVTGMSTERVIRPTGWGLCNGTGPYDMNDGYTSSYSGTVSSSTSTSVTVSGAPWTAGVYNFSTSGSYSLASPGTYYVAYDTTYGDLGGIISNTSNTLTFSWKLSNLTGTFGGGGHSFDAGSRFIIYGVNLYQAGTMTAAGGSGATTLTDSSKSWTSNQWLRAGHAISVIDVTQGFSGQIGENTTDTIQYFGIPFNYNANANYFWNTRDQYAFTSASVCLDQNSVGPSQLHSVNATYTPTPAQPTTQSVDATYEFDESFGSGASPRTAAILNQNLSEQPNINYYYTNPSFDGTNGTGFGTLASRPSTCTVGVGYWATDQGSWNQSGGSNPVSYSSQGTLYICGENGWSSGTTYTPYTYPHPLISGGTTGSSVNPPSDLVATVQ